MASASGVGERAGRPRFLGINSRRFKPLLLSLGRSARGLRVKFGGVASGDGED